VELESVGLWAVSLVQDALVGDIDTASDPDWELDMDMDTDRDTGIRTSLALEVRVVTE